MGDYQRIPAVVCLLGFILTLWNLGGGFGGVMRMVEFGGLGVNDSGTEGHDWEQEHS